MTSISFATPSSRPSHALLIGEFSAEFLAAFAEVWSRIGGTLQCQKASARSFERADTTGCAAIAAYITSREEEYWIERTQVPAVNVSALLNHSHIPQVTVDQHAVGNLAAEHFLEHGHQYFACVGYADLRLSEERLLGYTQRVREAKRESWQCLLQDEDRHGPHGLGLQPNSVRRIAEWLKQLPRPLAIFAANDSLALATAQAIRSLRALIPEDYAVLGTDNSPITAAASPQISSIELPQAVLGRRCANMLVNALNGTPLIQHTLFPMDIAQRISTSYFAFDQPFLQSLNRRIQHYQPAVDRQEHITVETIAQDLAVSPRQLNRRLRSKCDTTLVRLLRRTKLRHARQWLSSSSMDITRIAQICGFGTRQGLAKALREEYGMAISDVRSVRRGNASIVDRKKILG